MELRDLPNALSAHQRIALRKTRIEQELGVDLSALTPGEKTIGSADEKNCEQMFGSVPVPVGYAGPLKVIFSSNQTTEVHLPLATTEGALVASVNRGCKALSVTGVKIESVYHGMSRSIAFKTASAEAFVDVIRSQEAQWKAAGEATSSHLKVLKFDLDMRKKYVFLTISCDTDEAMGMNMTTIAAQAIADWLVKNSKGVECITIAANVDSDKKPSERTKRLGRGYEVRASAVISKETITDILKTTPQALVNVAEAKLTVGSDIAGSLGKNLHAANIVAALYLATGQDAAHVVEGSLADTDVAATTDGIKISVRLPAVLVGVRGGGTALPAQAQCLGLILKNKAGLPAQKQLAETVGAAVLAGELSLLAAQSNQTLARAHASLGR